MKTRMMIMSNHMTQSMKINNKKKRTKSLNSIRSLALETASGQSS